MLLHPVSACMTDPSSAGVLELLRSADVAIGNCEISGFDPAKPGPVPQAESGGFWLNAGPNGIADLRALGFTMMSRANNHAVDFGTAGMEETDRLLTEHRIVHAGTGPTLAAARAPAYLTTRAGRTALISATDSAPRFANAGHARPDVIGRPGVNAIHAALVKVVDAATFQALLTALAVAGRQDCSLGHLVADVPEIQGLGPPIRKGDCPDDTFVLCEADVDENLTQVRLARVRSDYVVFALHTHLSSRHGNAPPQSIRDLARGAVEAGADVVLCHGPHILRGIEIHRGRPIFYSLGNFMCHLLKLEHQPADWYRDWGADPIRSRVHDVIGEGSIAWEKRDDAHLWESVIARIVDEGSTRRVELHPIDLSPHASGSQHGTPRLADARTARRIVERVAELSAAFGTNVVCAAGIGTIECSS